MPASDSVALVVTARSIATTEATKSQPTRRRARAGSSAPRVNSALPAASARRKGMSAAGKLYGDDGFRTNRARMSEISNASETKPEPKARSQTGIGTPAREASGLGGASRGSASPD